MKIDLHTPKYGSDLIVDLLSQHQIEYIAFNPGASIRGLHDSMVNYENHKKPELILCCHEEIATSIAHGYAKASGRYMAIAVHANVGLMHASMAIYNAWCDRVPMLVIGGTGPIDSDKRRPWIDWIHGSNIQANIVSDFVKWHDQPHSIAAAVDAVYRACKITDTDPKAPVYLSISTTVQDEEISSNTRLADHKKYSPPNAPPANENDIKKSAELIMNAEFPVIIVDHMGRSPSSVKHLTALSELLGIAVLDRCGRYNFPTAHPQCLTGADEDIIRQADLVLALDVQDLHGALGCHDNSTGRYKSYLADGSKIISISMNDYLIGSWAADYHKLYPIDITIAADSSIALIQLYDYCKNNIKNKNFDYYANRIVQITRKRDTCRKEWITEAAADNTELTLQSALYTIWNSVKNEDFVLTNCGGLTVRSWVKKLWEFDNDKASFVGIDSGGAGLGYGLGASIGAALAYKNSGKICINIQNDGDFLFTPSALWTAAHHNIPLLIIVMNNRSYGLTDKLAAIVAANRSRDTKNSHVGTAINNPAINYSEIANGFGMNALGSVKTKEQLSAAVYDAVKIIKEKRLPVLIDVLF